MAQLTDEQRKALNADIPGEYVKTKPGKGGLSYVPGWWVQDQANQILGPDGWSQETISKRIVFGPQKMEDGKWMVVYEAHVRVTMGGATRDGCACGSGDGYSLPDVMHAAIGEAETDAAKRALKSFSRRLGLALYEKPDDDGQRTHVDDRDDAGRAAMAMVADLRTEAEAGSGSAVAAAKAVAEHRKAIVSLPKQHKATVLEDLTAVAELVAEGDARATAIEWITGQKMPEKAA